MPSLVGLRSAWGFRLLVALLAGVVLIPLILLAQSSERAATAATGQLSPLSARRVAFGWIPWWNLSEGVATVQAHPKLFADASIFWYTATAQNSVETVADDTHDVSELTTAIEQLHESGVRALVTVEDLGMDSTSMGRLLADAGRRKALIASIVATVTSVGADGVDIDFEHMNFPSNAWRSIVANKFPVFLTDLRTALHRHGGIVSLAVPARTSNKDPNWSIYDYRALGKAVDRIRLMTYDYHYAGGDPGPLAPLDWVREVATYARHAIGKTPVSLGQISTGLNWYVRRESGKCPSEDPPVTDTAVPTIEQARKLAADWGASITWDKASGEYHFRYHRKYAHAGKKCTVLREVWFEDARSLRLKLNLAAQFGLQGTALWTLGNEDPKTWNALNTFAKKRSPAPARSTIGGPATVGNGDAFSVNGRFTVAGDPAVGGSVHVQRSMPGHAWHNVATMITSSTGRITYDAAGHRTYDWRLRLDPEWDWATTVSKIKQVKVINATSSGGHQD